MNAIKDAVLFLLANERRDTQDPHRSETAQKLALAVVNEKAVVVPEDWAAGIAGPVTLLPNDCRIEALDAKGVIEAVKADIESDESVLMPAVIGVGLNVLGAAKHIQDQTEGSSLSDSLLHVLFEHLHTDEERPAVEEQSHASTATDPAPEPTVAAQ